ncbi:MAG: hypothetical protein J5753_03755 [Oscillospiraceae bacterium]|nr:hypothetical protein [Oscillospiraceae bacterium]
MFIKPKHKASVPKPAIPERSDRQNQLSRNNLMIHDMLNKLSRDHVMIQKKLKILSVEYVIEHGIDFEDEEIGFDEANFYFVCDSEGYFTGLIYKKNDNGNLMSYTFYEDGLKDGVEVSFYPSGKIHYYSFYRKGKITGKFYEWYENGMIKKYIDRIHDKRIEADEQGNITKQGKAD